MKFSYNWLQEYFEQKLPSPEVLGDLITYHSSEIEELIPVGDDVTLDVKVLPDKSAWLMSHRGLAKEISVMLDQPLKQDLLNKKLDIISPEKISIKRETEKCDFYSAALLTGIKVGPSPEWLVKKLATVGQRSINNIVDATNYVMFELGQPLHAFDAAKIGMVENTYAIRVRTATSGEKITVLTGEEFALTTSDMVITDQNKGSLLGIAGVKGGAAAAVDINTTAVILESAHFDRKEIRHTAKSLKLNTDASKRFENGIKAAVAPIALLRVIDFIMEVAGGELVAVNASGEMDTKTSSVIVSLEKINSVLGLELTVSDITSILDRFAYEYQVNGEQFSVTPPFERDDLVLAEDVIEEIGRMYGLDKINAIPPSVMPVKEYNARHYYSEKIRTVLVKLGFSEVYTSSFRNKDKVKLANALASDKEYLRSTLVSNLSEVRINNIPHRDLLGLVAVKIFEIGTVFDKESEEFRVALAVQTGTTYKAKVDDGLVKEALAALGEELGVDINLMHSEEGVVEFSLDKLLKQLPPVTKYEIRGDSTYNTYEPFSVYPAMSRDVSFWATNQVAETEIQTLLQKNAGPLCVRVTHLDTFTKDNRTSYAFRLVFQALDHTLTDIELEPVMERVYHAIKALEWEAR
ncbi:MAG TPA: phenylalanine--tRNA ligase subunit beta [Candidatus Paceibacterota bacterium]|nr:phenylalanine--tRNA ligase subunit beta [Candidatus Paceibacterota bacterium]